MGSAIGGLIFSGFLTLYVIPAIYSYVSRKSATVSNVADAVPEEASSEWPAEALKPERASTK